MATVIASTRLDGETERRVDATAERRGMTRSDWLRQVVEAAIEAEAHAADQVQTFVGMDKRLTSLEGDLLETRKTADENLLVVNELSDTLAIERAADRAVAQQTYRMAFRAAYLTVKQITDEVREEQRDGLGAELCAESDDLCNDIGQARLDQVMRDAREELRQSIERGGLS